MSYQVLEDRGKTQIHVAKWKNPVWTSINYVIPIQTFWIRWNYKSKRSLLPEFVEWIGEAKGYIGKCFSNGGCMTLCVFDKTQRNYSTWRINLNTWNFNNILHIILSFNKKSCFNMLLKELSTEHKKQTSK